MLPDFRIEHPHLQIPIVLLIDDPAPQVNPYYYHMRLRQKEGELKLPSGEPCAREIPLSFLHRFIETIERTGIKGKFSVLPYPCNLGFIGRGLEGYPESECREWVKAVRERLAPWMDFSPEMITHNWAVDVDTMAALDEDEHAWSQHQNEASLTKYIAKAVQMLADAGIDANGVTSPWHFGHAVEGEYARAIGNAQRQVHGRRLTWYFLRSDALSAQVPPQVATGKVAEGEAVVHIRGSLNDNLWQTMNTLDASDEYVRKVADAYLTEDGRDGRIPSLIAGGSQVTFVTHWQSVFAQGRATGLKALEETARRIVRAYGKRAAWRKCSEVSAAAACAAGLKWRAETAGSGLRFELQSPFECAGFAFSCTWARAPRRVAAYRAGEGGGAAAVFAQHDSGDFPLPSGRYCWDGARATVCLDLRGPVAVEVE